MKRTYGPKGTKIRKGSKLLDIKTASHKVRTSSNDAVEFAPSKRWIAERFLSKDGANKVIDELGSKIDIRFAALSSRVDAVDKKVDELRAEMNVRFEGIDARFDASDKMHNENHMELIAKFNELLKELRGKR